MIILIVLLVVGFGVMMYDFMRVSEQIMLLDERVKRIEHRMIANEVVKQ
jgi:hypothetical protein